MPRGYNGTSRPSHSEWSPSKGENMKPMAVDIEDKTILVPKLKVQELIDLGVLRHERERKNLIEDLEDSGATQEEKLAQLREHRKERGLASILVRSAFTVDGSFQIIRLAMGGEFPEAFETLDPTRLSRIALGCLGLDLDDLVEEEATEGKEPTNRETGTSKPPSLSGTAPASLTL